MTALHLATVVAIIASAILGSRVLAIGLLRPRVPRPDPARRLRGMAGLLGHSSAGAVAQGRRR